MKNTLSIFCAICAMILTFSCKKEAPASLEVTPTELNWEWNDTEPRTVTVTANYDWTAEVSDAANWTLTITDDGKTFTVAPKDERKIEEALTATVTVASKELTKTITCTQAGGPFVNGHEYVDLGLGVKWATCNVGAKSETDYGSYFAWGETAEKTNYAWENSGEYKWGTYDDSASPDYGMTKYNTTDRITTLEAGDDPATVAWGSKWRSPSSDEIMELIDDTKCEWLWKTKTDANGADVNGCTVTSKINGKSIFLPAAGYRYGTELCNLGNDTWYWSSSSSNLYPTYAWYFNFGSYYHTSNISPRFHGYPVRAVTK